MQGSKRATLGELFVWIGVYVVVLFAAVGLVFLLPVPAPWRSLVVLIPLLPALGIVRWETRAFAQLDEMQLRNQILGLAWAFTITAILMTGYILLEAVGWPRPPMWVIFTTMILIQTGCAWVQYLRYR